jgi:hypothetical protein
MPPNSVHLESGLMDVTDSFFRKKIDKEIVNLFADPIDVDTLLEIPCYCDIQFKEREFLTSHEYPSHPFTEKMKNLVSVLEDADY